MSNESTVVGYPGTSDQWVYTFFMADLRKSEVEVSDQTNIKLQVSDYR